MSFNRAGVKSAFDEAIWGARLDELPWWRAWGLRVIRLLLVVIRDLSHGELTMHAMSLVYTTLLSLVPLLALSFSVLKAFGVYNQIGPMLAKFLEPLGAQGEEISERIVQFIQNLNVGVLGSVGLALLIYTAVSLMQKVEASFNFIWQITQPRRMSQRFSNYLTVLLIGPLLVFSAIGITASAMSAAVVQDVLEVEPIGRLAFEIGRLMPYVLVIGAFTFVYIFLPNTKVHLVPALVGGTVGGILWQSAGWAFALFAASSGRYSAIYSSFAILILFMIWLYLSWIILLLGATVAFYVQHPDNVVAQSGQPRLSNRVRERLALLIMSLIGQHHAEGRPPWTLQQVTQRLRVPMYGVERVLDALHQGGLLVQSNDDPPGYLPARDLANVSVKDVLDTVRSAGEDRFLSPDRLPAPGEVEDVIQRLDETARQTVGNISVKELAARYTSDTAQHEEEQN